MAPSNQALYVKDEKVLCFHMELLYEAKVLDVAPIDPSAKKQDFMYKVHYKGWKNTWDDWVKEDRLRKYNEENVELAKNIKKDLEAQRAPPKKTEAANKKKKTLPSDLSSARGSEERHASTQAGAGPRGQKRGRDNEIEREEAFHNRPSIRILTPDNLKSYLVDDWEAITKNLQLVPLPSSMPVNTIMDQYHEEESAKRREGSSEAEILNEVVQGVKEYFDKALGRVLLYRFERQQFREVYEAMEKGTTEFAGKSVGDIYGVEHLCRLFVSLPEMIALTNMDPQSVNRLREELSKLTQWISKNSAKYFVTAYENTSAEYQEKAKGN